MIDGELVIQAENNDKTLIKGYVTIIYQYNTYLIINLVLSIIILHEKYFREVINSKEIKNYSNIIYYNENQTKLYI